MIRQKRRMQGYLAGRTIILLSMMVLVALFSLRQGNASHPSVLWFFTATIITLIFTALSSVLLKKDALANITSKIQPLWDILYISLVIYLSGGWRSPMVFLYLIAIIGSTAIFFRPGAFIAATYATLAFGLVTALQFNGILVPLNPFPFNAVAQSSNVSVNLALHIVAFYAIAFLSGMFAEEIRLTGERLDEAQDEILALEHLQGAILQSMGGGLVALDGQGKVMFFNPSAKQLLGRANMAFENSDDLEKLFDLKAVGRREVSVEDSEIVLGYSTFPLLAHSGQRAGTILAFSDLTEVSKLEKRLKLSDRLAAVGRLAAGLAHEIRNPLASLSGSVQMLKSSLPPSAVEKEQRVLLEIVLRETDRLNRLVSNFLDYARPEATNRMNFNLHQLVDELEFFFRHGEGATGFTLTNQVAEGMEVNADREQIEQMLLNLFKNSIEATSNDVSVLIRAARHGKTVVIEVHDNGPGFSEDIADKVFEPFVTNKDGGTGLGLALVHRIAQNHNGTAEALHSDETSGALVRIRIEVE